MECKWIIAKKTRTKATKEFKKLIIEDKNIEIQNYLENLSATEATDYSLFKATKKLKRSMTFIPAIGKTNGKWARKDEEKHVTFVKHLEKVFKPLPRILSLEEEKALLSEYKYI